jgi:Uma2 family endonuclease
LSRPEFEWRYAASPHVKKAELIEGVVYVASPLRFVLHAEPHGNLVAWLGIYKAMTPGLRMGIEPTVRLDFDNEPQPDVMLFLDESVGGQVHLTADGYMEGPPELTVEVAASSVAIDTGSKKQAYCRNGALEYIIWQSYENKLDW